MLDPYGRSSSVAAEVASRRNPNHSAWM